MDVQRGGTHEVGCGVEAKVREGNVGAVADPADQCLLADMCQ